MKTVLSQSRDSSSSEQKSNLGNSQGDKIIPLFLPHQGCPHRCIFCNQPAVTGIQEPLSPSDVYPFINQCLKTISENPKPERTKPRREVAFYGSNFTGLPRSKQAEYLLPAYLAVKEGKIDGLRVSTRPDYLDQSQLSFLIDHGLTTIELGIQSLDEEVLQIAKRAYGRMEVERAVKLISHTRLNWGLHVMIGLPGETRESFLITLEGVIRFSPHFVRIHPTLVIKDTELEKMYQQGNYQPLSLEQAIELCKIWTLRCRKAQIKIARIGLQSTPQMSKSGTVMAGPFHPALGELVASSIASDRMKALLQQKNLGQGRVKIRVAASELSVFIGQHRQNLHLLKQEFDQLEIEVVSEPDLAQGDILIEVIN